MHRSQPFHATSLSTWNLDFHRRLAKSSNRTTSRHAKHGRKTEPCYHSWNFNGGRVWIEDEEGTSIETTTKNGKVRELKGTWIDIHDKPMSFNARRFHKIEPHEGQMWALAAYTPQSFERCSDEVRSKLEELEFPCLMRFVHIQNKISLPCKHKYFIHSSSAPCNEVWP